MARRFECTRRLSHRRRAPRRNDPLLFPPSDHLEHRARIVVPKAQVEIVEIGYRRGDAQTQSATGNAMTAFGAIKPLEDLVAFCRFDTNSVVPNADDRMAVFLRHGNAHGAV